LSRIGKKPVVIPQGVALTITDRLVTAKGPKGELKWTHPAKVEVAVEGGSAVVKRAEDTKECRALHGLSRSLIQNMVKGVSEGYTRVLEIQGVGYRAQVQGDKLTFSLGYSHPVEFALPQGIKAEVDKKQVVITLAGADKHLIGQVAADMKALRPPDSYKGKGLRYQGEFIKLKAGQAGKK
jgi:large subunit ribosomal protein L6